MNIRCPSVENDSADRSYAYDTRKPGAGNNYPPPRTEMTVNGDCCYAETRFPNGFAVFVTRTYTTQNLSTRRLICSPCTRVRFTPLSSTRSGIITRGRDKTSVVRANECRPEIETRRKKNVLRHNDAFIRVWGIKISSLPPAIAWDCRRFPRSYVVGAEPAAFRSISSRTVFAGRLAATFSADKCPLKRPFRGPDVNQTARTNRVTFAAGALCAFRERAPSISSRKPRALVTVLGRCPTGNVRIFRETRTVHDKMALTLIASLRLNFRQLDTVDFT